jgi:RHS repeat-associated protein
VVKDGDTPLYLMGDHLGSTSLVVNTSGAQVARRSYLLFGAQWAASGSLPTDFGFTGQREADEIGLYYYVARWLDPEIGHFVQADTIVPGAGNPAAWNRYAYVGYNPVRYTDPSGNWPVGDDIDIGLILDKICKSGDCPDDMEMPEDLPSEEDLEGYPKFGNRSNPNSPHPNIPGLEDGDWEWGVWDGIMGWKNKFDPYGVVWRFDWDRLSNSGKEGEAPHWHFFSDPCNGAWPSNYQWGRGGNDHAVHPVFGPETGEYVSNAILIITIADSLIRSVPWDVVGPILYGTFSGGGFRNEWGSLEKID